MAGSGCLFFQFTFSQYGVLRGNCGDGLTGHGAGRGIS